MAAGVADDVRRQQQCAAVLRLQRAVVGGIAATKGCDIDRAAGHIGRDAPVVDEIDHTAGDDLRARNRAVLAAYDDVGADRYRPRWRSPFQRNPRGPDRIAEYDRSASSTDGLIGVKREDAVVVEIDRAAVEGQSTSHTLDARGGCQVQDTGQRYASEDVGRGVGRAKNTRSRGIDRSAGDRRGALLHHTAGQRIDLACSALRDADILNVQRGAVAGFEDVVVGDATSAGVGQRNLAGGDIGRDGAIVDQRIHAANKAREKADGAVFTANGYARAEGSAAGAFQGNSIACGGGAEVDRANATNGLRAFEREQTSRIDVDRTRPAEGKATGNALDSGPRGQIKRAIEGYAGEKVVAAVERRHPACAGGVDRAAGDRAAELVHHAVGADIDHAASVCNVMTGADLQRGIVGNRPGADIDGAGVDGASAALQREQESVDIHAAGVGQIQNGLAAGHQVDSDGFCARDDGAVCPTRDRPTRPVARGAPQSRGRIPRAVQCGRRHRRSQRQRSNKQLRNQLRNNSFTGNQTFVLGLASGHGQTPEGCFRHTAFTYFYEL